MSAKTDEETVKPCIQDRLRTLFSLNEEKAIILSVMVIMIIIGLFSVPPLRQYWPSFYPAVMATFLGIFLGFTLDRVLKRAQEKEIMNRILISIMKELEINVKDIETWEFKDTITYFMKSQNTAYDSAIGGGYFALMDSDTQHKLSVLYSNINYIEYMADRLLFVGDKDFVKLADANSFLNKKLILSIKEHEELIKYLRARVRLET